MFEALAVTSHAVHGTPQHSGSVVHEDRGAHPAKQLFYQVDIADFRDLLLPPRPREVKDHAALEIGAFQSDKRSAEGRFSTERIPFGGETQSLRRQLSQIGSLFFQLGSLLIGAGAAAGIVVSKCGWRSHPELKRADTEGNEQVVKARREYLTGLRSAAIVSSAVFSLTTAARYTLEGVSASPDLPQIVAGGMVVALGAWVGAFLAKDNNFEHDLRVARDESVLLAAKQHESISALLATPPVQALVAGHPEPVMVLQPTESSIVPAISPLQSQVTIERSIKPRRGDELPPCDKPENN